MNAWRTLIFVGMPLAALLALGMALRSAPDSHPDEIFHAKAAEYYRHHWLPPRVGDPRTLDSYSAYGSSYLSDFDPSYFFAGKIAALFQPLGVEALYAARLAGVLLFGVLGALALGLKGWELFFVPLLLSPQIWYLFSYANNDAFPLAASFILAILLVSPEGALARFFRGGSHLRERATALLVAVTLAALLLSKFNYVFVAGFFAAYLLSRCGSWILALVVVLGLFPAMVAARLILQPRFEHLVGAVISGVGVYLLARHARRAGGETVRRFVRTCIVLSGAALLALVVRAYVIIINGGADQMARSIADRVAAKAAEKPQASDGKLSTRPPTGLRLRERGIPFHRMFLAPWHWAQSTAATSAGLYGYMSARGSLAYYLAYFGAAALFILIAARLAWAAHSPGDPTLPVVAILFIATVVLASAYHSWTTDFQPQGRYLFPTLPVVGLLLLHYRNALIQSRLVVIAALIFGLSSYSFVFVGIRGLPAS